MLDDSTTKWCPRCEVVKSVGDFYASKMGLSAYCRPCHVAYNSERRRITRGPSTKIPHPKPSEIFSPSAQRECSKCGETRPIDEFYISSEGLVRGICRACHALYRAPRPSTGRPIGRPKGSKNVGQRETPDQLECTSCGVTKPLADYYMRKDRNQPMRECKTCLKDRTSAYFRENREHTTERARQNAQKKYAERTTLLARYKDHPCVDCGVKYEPCVMEFDHISGVKRYNVSQMRTMRLEVLEAEIAKCDLVCAICHRRRTCARSGHVTCASFDDLT